MWGGGLGGGGRVSSCGERERERGGGGKRERERETGSWIPMPQHSGFDLYGGLNEDRQAESVNPARPSRS